MSSVLRRLQRLEQQRAAVNPATPVPADLRVANIIEFVTGREWLDRPSLLRRLPARARRRWTSPADPMIFTVQLPSWDPYLDWERTHHALQMWPGGPAFPRLHGPLMTVDDDLQRQQRIDPQGFRVEYQAQWATSAHAYLDPDLVRQTFSHNRLMRDRAEYGRDYILHFDPSYSGANFAIAIAHREMAQDGTTLIVFDYLTVHEPKTFEGGRIDYAFVEEHLKQLITDFRPTSVTGDQYNPQLLQSLQKWAAQQQFEPAFWMAVRHATSKSNWQEAETFKTALHRGQIISPTHKLARDELLFLELRGDKKVEHPRTGPVRTSDLVDCMFSLTGQLLEDSDSGHAQLGERWSAQVSRRPTCQARSRPTRWRTSGTPGARLRPGTPPAAAYGDS